MDEDKTNAALEAINNETVDLVIFNELYVHHFRVSSLKGNNHLLLFACMHNASFFVVHLTAYLSNIIAYFSSGFFLL